jgi:hypothetical protein
MAFQPILNQVIGMAAVVIHHQDVEEIRRTGTSLEDLFLALMKEEKN